MNESGGWFPAQYALEHASRTIDAIYAARAEYGRSFAVTAQKKGRWSWRRFRRIPLTWEEAQKHIPVNLDIYHGRQMMNAERLWALASESVELLPEATIFLTKDDLWDIR